MKNNSKQVKEMLKIKPYNLISPIGYAMIFVITIATIISWQYGFFEQEDTKQETLTIPVTETESINEEGIDDEITSVLTDEVPKLEQAEKKPVVVKEKVLEKKKSSKNSTSLAKPIPTKKLLNEPNRELLEFDYKKVYLPKSVQHHFDKMDVLQEEYKKNNGKLKEMVFTESSTISGNHFVKSFKVNKGVKLTVEGELYLFSETDVIVDGKIESVQKINENGDVQKGDVVIKSLNKIKVVNGIVTADGRTSETALKNKQDGVSGGDIVLFADVIGLGEELSPGYGGNGKYGGNGGNGGSTILLHNFYYSIFGKITGGNGGSGSNGNYLLVLEI